MKKQLDNPVCALTISCLPKIYGPKHQPRFLPKVNRMDPRSDYEENQIVTHRQEKEMRASFLRESSPYYVKGMNRIIRERVTIDTYAMETLVSERKSRPRGLPRIKEEGKTRYRRFNTLKAETTEEYLESIEKKLASNNKKSRNASQVQTERPDRLRINEVKLREWTSLTLH